MNNRKNIREKLNALSSNGDQSLTIDFMNTQFIIAKTSIDDTYQLHYDNKLIIGSLDDVYDNIIQNAYKYIKCNHVTHYIKYNLSDNLSIRYYFSFTDNNDLVGQYVIKDHSNKTYDVISMVIAKQMINELTVSIHEVIGRSINGNYSKIINIM